MGKSGPYHRVTSFVGEHISPPDFGTWLVVLVLLQEDMYDEVGRYYYVVLQSNGDPG